MDLSQDNELNVGGHDDKKAKKRDDGGQSNTIM